MIDDDPALLTRGRQRHLLSGATFYSHAHSIYSEYGRFKWELYVLYYAPSFEKSQFAIAITPEDQGISKWLHDKMLDDYEP